MKTYRQLCNSLLTKSLIVLLCVFTSSRIGAQVTLTFTGKDNLDNYVQLHHVVVENVTQDWTDTLYYPDTILIMSGVGLPDYESASAFSVSQNVPNPFDGVTDFTMTLSYEDKVAIEVFDMAGKRVTGATQRLTSGSHSFRVWLNKPQSYLLSVKTSRDAASIKMVNNGHDGQNRIQYLNASPLTYELRSTMSGDHPYTPGDLMRYTGFAFLDSSFVQSATIEQPVHEDELFELVFHLWEYVEQEGHFIDTNTLFIPDGQPCNGSCFGVMNFNVSGYPINETIQTAGDIRYLRLKAEHSYLGDLWISLTCPNGQRVSILKKYSTGSSGCSAQIPAADWGWQTSDSPVIRLGLYNKSDGADKCDPTQNPMGICWNYCWSNNVSEDYQYACSNALVYESCNHIYASNPFPNTQINNSYVDSTDVVNMTNVYHPDQSFATLIGCPLNGLWQVQFIDGFSQDNGYVEEAELALLPVSDYLMTSKPTVVTGSSSSVSYYSATCGGDVVNDGFLPITARGICWDTIPEPNIAGQHTTEGSGTGIFTSTLANLEAGITYYFRAFASNELGTTYGETKSFTTLANTPPSVTTVNVTNVTGVSATAGGIITDDGGLPIIEKGICWSTYENPDISGDHVTSTANTGTFACQLSALTQGTTYHVRAYATNTSGITYGEQQVFTTLDLPSGLTITYSDVSDTSVTFTGTILSDGGTPLSSKGFCWSTSPQPSLSDNIVTVSGSGTGSFSRTLNGLEPGTYYYARTFATNVLGTAFSDDTLLYTIPFAKVVTSCVHYINASSAVVEGQVIHDGNLPVIEKGVCYSTSATPTIDSATIPAGAGIGNFTCTLNGLSSNTKYYVRAYATNSVCTAYGNTFVFYTGDSTFTCGESIITDYDGNLYHTVAIGSQCWFKENVKTTHYADGTAIPLASGSDITDAARYYPNGDADNVSVYGYLYNHFAAMRGNPPADSHGICPEGWHVPSNIDWQTLANYLLSRPPYICNFSPTVPTYCKSLAADHSWTTHNGICTIGNNLADNNATDLSLLPAGLYYADIGSSFFYQSFGGYHYNPLQGDNNHMIDFASYNADVIHTTGSQTAIMASVRCLRDTPLNDPFLVVITDPAESITESTAVIPYSVNLYSSDTLITSGLCWGTEPNPTLNDNTISNSITNEGTFSATLNGLTGNTVYYVRAYASNSFGTVYGRQRTFTTAP